MIRLLKNLWGRLQGWGGCSRCHDSFTWKPWHETTYEPGTGCFPLCQPCFLQADRDDIIAAYSNLMRLWRQGGSWVPPQREEQIVNAALQERGYRADWKAQF